ncbi:hypothetical protein GCK72_016084 [Caenorhabditis remanei]|uniref:Uncharacterized protein n=1 Tax=Caenorhabditis remanei TaxID=31234 RepID=A0A6A5GWR3_CAERE|nr:hypothetical protein GCK72_016084 [Caenorhabditis remanei]KAF1759617.1 hypothetical protein GCK72_016084 [Caenorhabditis remanei]
MGRQESGNSGINHHWHEFDIVEDSGEFFQCIDSWIDVNDQFKISWWREWRTHFGRWEELFDDVQAFEMLEEGDLKTKIASKAPQLLAYNFTNGDWLNCEFVIADDFGYRDSRRAGSLDDVANRTDFTSFIKFELIVLNVFIKCHSGRGISRIVQKLENLVNARFGGGGDVVFNGF